MINLDFQHNALKRIYSCISMRWILFKSAIQVGGCRFQLHGMALRWGFAFYCPLLAWTLEGMKHNCLSYLGTAENACFHVEMYAQTSFLLYLELSYYSSLIRLRPLQLCQYESGLMQSRCHRV
jgi:hypothetical protein